MAICAVSKVANLADHDHVRVLAQDGAQRFGKREVDLGVDLRLAYSREFVFNRVFHGHDVARCRRPVGLSAA
jgi:hypothetical protein